jgi:syntaxin 5
MTGPSIQDRTSEFSAILGQAQKRMGTSKVGSQRQALLSDAQRRQANASPQGAAQEAKAARSEFARRARDIGRGITGTMAKLQRLAERESGRNGWDDTVLIAK